ncbi:cytochrome c oxidase, subunit III [Mycolicibacterium rhodesiae JS60]|nr:cytochrome c oxidase, subunit III [Mycolicibacterium rhodesiae JS60]
MSLIDMHTTGSTSEVPVSREQAVAARTWVPGEAGIWALILTDLGVFTVYFITFMYQWPHNRQAFAAGHSAITMSAGILNTFFLLSASLFVALGVQRVRLGLIAQTRRLFALAGVAGAAFVVNKYFEWSHELSQGRTPRTDTFFQMYFVLTGIHLVHVLIAMTLLWFMRGSAKTVCGTPTFAQARFIENCSSYWHMVDLLWLVLLALFYLMGRTG